MKAKLSIWDQLTRMVIVIAFVAGLVMVYRWYVPLIQRNQRYRKEIFALETKIATEEKRSHQLRAAIDAAQNDPRTIERMAREVLGLAKTNETVLRFEPPRR